jgi:dephospho-CoA kinase
MLKIGLTGNIGSGKSTVAKIFKILGIPVYHSDIEAKKFLTDKTVMRELTNKFGTEIVTESKIDNKKLASIVFKENDSLIFLNNLIHPLVKEDFENWCNTVSPTNKYIIQEAAILFESNFDKYVDKTILVIAPENIRLERVIKRDSISKEEVLKRMANQWDEERKVKLADFLINNNDKELLIPQLIEIHKKIINDIV